MTALVFGASGQDGHYVSEHCRQRGMQVVAVSRSAGDVIGDVSDAKLVTELVQQQKPDIVLHLAAKSTTAHSAGMENHATISTGSLNVLEAVYRHCPAAKVFITGSGVQFENRGLPISENDPFAANSLYSVSRIESVYAARYYRRLGVKAYVGYLFHHESPLRKPDHMSRKIVDAARRIATGSDEVLELGDISVKKEWTFAGDVTRGILCLLDQDKVMEAAIGSGLAYSIGDWLDECFALIGRDWRKSIRLRSGFKPEYSLLVSNPATIRSLGWAPLVSLSEMARMMMLPVHK